VIAVRPLCLFKGHWTKLPVVSYNTVTNEQRIWNDLGGHSWFSFNLYHGICLEGLHSNTSNSVGISEVRFGCRTQSLQNTKL
jgi:hypothetical protein